MSLTSEASVTSTAEEVPAGPPSTVKVQPSRATAGFSGRLGAWPRLGLFHAFWRRDNRSDPQRQLTVWPTRCAGTPFVWSQTHNLILTDATGAPVLQSAAWPAVQLTVSMQVPLLHHVRCAARAYRGPDGFAPMCSRQPPTPCAHSTRARTCSSGAAALLGRAPPVDVAQEVDAAQAARARHVRRQARRRVGVGSLGRVRVSWVGRVPHTLGWAGRG